MRPVRLTMSAFGPYSGLEVIDFEELQERNLFLITGPTGSGKTTIFDAISYALYGKASGDLRTEETLRSHFSEPETLTEVHLTFELKGITYHIHRVPKQMRPKVKTEGFTEQKPEATLTIEDGNPRTVIRGVSRVSSKIEELLGINIEQFKQIMMIPQGEFRKLLTSNSEEREKVLQQLFDTYIYRRIQSELNEQAKTLGSDIKGKKVQRDTLITKIKCGDDEVLESLINAEDKFTEVIIQQTKWLIEADQEALDKLVDVLKTIEKDIEKTHKKKGKALENNKNLEDKLQIAEELKVQEARSEEMEQQQQQIIQAERAARLIGKEDDIRLRERDLTKKTVDQVKTQTEVLTLEESLMTASEALEAESTPEAESYRNEMKLKLANYKSYTDKVENLESLTKDIATIDKIHEELSGDIEENKTNSVQCQSCLVEKQKAIDELKDVGVSLERSLAKKVKEDSNRIQLTKVKGQLQTLASESLNVSKKNEAMVIANKTFEAINRSYQDNRLVFLTNQAAFLAKELRKDEACPVCGSLDHPMPAVLTGEVVTDDELEQIKEEVAVAEKKYVEAKEKSAVKEERYANLEESVQGLMAEIFGAMEAGEVERQIEKVDQALRDSDQLSETINVEIIKLEADKKLRKSLSAIVEKLIDEIEVIDTNVKELNQDKLEIVAKQVEKKTNLANIHKEVPEALRQMSELTRLIGEIKGNIASDATKLQKVKKSFESINNQHIAISTKNEVLSEGIAEDVQTLETLQKDFANQREVAGFETIEAYNLAKLEEIQLGALKKAQADYLRNLDRLKESLKELVKKTEGLAVVNLQLYEELLLKHQEGRTTITDQQGVVKARITDNKNTIGTVITINDQIKDKEANYNVVGKLARIAQGNNPAMMTFERYVLAAFLEDILKAANTRLRQMTQGRYIMSRTSELQRKNRQSGLELEIFDNFTGKSRHVKTLSGGEGFKASLSMALGLSDVVQSYAGGVRLDTMFIDEGFGTLDQESLDSAINCLIDLQKSGRLVGIISHVQDLKERIDTRLEIVSSNRGSTSRFVLG